MRRVGTFILGRPRPLSAHRRAEQPRRRRHTPRYTLNCEEPFTENVPYYDDLYTRLGEVWRDRNPTELEKQLLVVVDGLSDAPAPVEELEAIFGLDHVDVPLIVQLAEDSGLLQKVRAIDGDIAYSPFFGFENPALLGELVNSHGGDQLAQEFAAVRAKQALPISPTSHPLLTDAVAKGLIMAPAVTVPGGGMQPFAALPYIADKKLLTARKPILDKALAVVACLRCAESFGGYSSLDVAGLINVIDKLLDPNRGFLSPHSGHKRQYELMRNARLIEFAPDTLPGGRWVTPTFIDTADNREALKLARELLTHGIGSMTSWHGRPWRPTGRNMRAVGLSVFPDLQFAIVGCRVEDVFPDEEKDRHYLNVGPSFNTAGRLDAAAV